MCRVVGADYNTVDRTEENWYMKYNWDIKTETKFSKWMADYIHKMPGAQEELYGKSRMSKKACTQATQLFIMSYGWKTNLESNNE